MKDGGQASQADRTPGMVVHKGMNGGQEKDAAHRRLQAKAKDVLAGDAGLKIPGIIDTESLRGQPAHQAGMDGDEERDKDKAGGRARLARDHDVPQADQGMKVKAQDQQVIQVERILMKKAKRDGDDGAENRCGIGGVDQPVVIEMAESRPGQAVQKILVLVGVIERGLGVG